MNPNLISAKDAIHLFLKIHRTDLNQQLLYETASVKKRPSCRICKSSSNETMECPCNCRGTLGHIHLKCLRKWIQHTKINFCEICHQPYKFERLQYPFSAMLREFFTDFYLGNILRYFLKFGILSEILYVNTRQLVNVINTLNLENSDPRPSIIFFPSFIFLLGLYYYLYLDWSVQSLQHIGAILADWWYNSWMNAAIRYLDSSFFADADDDESSDEDEFFDD